MEASRTKRVTQNITYNVVSQILSLLLSFISRSVFIYYLGVEYLGINGLFSDVLNLLSLADLGFTTAMTFSFYKPLAEKDYKKMAGLSSFYRKIYLVIAIAVTVIGLALIPFLGYIVNVENEIPHLTIYYLLSLAGVVVSYVCVYKTAVITADQKGYIVTKITMITSVVKTILQIIILVLYRNYIAYLVIGVVVNLLNNLIASIVAEKHYPFIRDNYELSKEEKKSIWNNISSMFIYKASSVMLNATDNILISIIVSTAMVGYYSNYLMLQTKVTMFYSLIFTSMTASIGNLIVREKAEKKYEIFNCQQIVSFIICGIVIPCYVLLVNDFINIWLGEEFVLSIGLTFIIGLNMYLGCVLQPLWSYREATGLYRKTKWAMLSCGILNIVLSVILGLVMGISGILLASALSRLMTYIWYEPKLLFKEYFNLKPWGYYLDIIKNVGFIFALIFIFELLFRNVAIDNILMWLIKAIIIGIVSTITMYLIYRNTQGYKILKERFLNKVIRKVKDIFNHITKPLTIKISNIYYFIKYKSYKKNRFNIISDEELVKQIVKNKKSLSRFGDGELKWAFDKANINFQDNDEKLSEKLREIILSDDSKNENCIVGIHRALNNIDEYTKTSKKFWRKFNVSNQKKIISKIPVNRIYGPANITRPYIAYEDKSKDVIEKRFNLIKEIWDKKNVVMVEGEKTRLGIGNDLFDNCKSIKRIICPPTNAFSKYEEICNAIRKQGKKNIYLLALGPTATIIAYDMSKEGYHCIDIGHIDIEYMWYKNNSKKVEKVPGKYVLEAEDTGEEEVINDEYKNQIVDKI